MNQKKWISSFEPVEGCTGKALIIKEETEEDEFICLVAPPDNITDQDLQHAKLIAAAPDLLAALKAVMISRETRLVPDVKKLVFAAIAKAEAEAVAAANTDDD